MSKDETLLADLRQLSESGIEPEHDLWPRLEQELRSQTPRVRSSVWRYVAAAAVLISISAGVSWRLTQRPSVSGFEEFNPARSLAQLPQASSREFLATFALYLDERQLILALIAKQLHDYPPELRDEIRSSIEEIEHAMIAIERSITRRPAAAESEAHLAELYELELRLLRVVNDRLQGAVSIGGMS